MICEGKKLICGSNWFASPTSPPPQPPPCLLVVSWRFSLRWGFFEQHQLYICCTPLNDLIAFFYWALACGPGPPQSPWGIQRKFAHIDWYLIIHRTSSLSPIGAVLHKQLSIPEEVRLDHQISRKSALMKRLL